MIFDIWCSKVSRAYLEKHVLFLRRLSKVSQHGSRHGGHRSSTDQLVESRLLATILDLGIRDTLLNVGLEPLGIASAKSRVEDLTMCSSHHQESP